MGSRAERALRQLKQFCSLVNNAAGLYASADELLRYCLPHGTLKELIEELWSLIDVEGAKYEVLKMLNEIADRIAANTAAAICALAKESNKIVDLKSDESWLLYEKCSGQKLVSVFSNCLILFHAIYETRSVAYIYSGDKIDKFERIHDAATQLLEQIGTKDYKKLLSTVLEHYGQKSAFAKEKTYSLAKNVLWFSKTDVTNLQQKDAESIAPNFASAVEKLLTKMDSHDYDIFEMRELVQFRQNDKIDIALFKRACSILPAVQEIVDVRVSSEFWKVLKRIAYSCNDWDSVMDHFYKEFSGGNSDLRNFGNSYQHFNEDKKNLLSNLQDHAQLHTNPDRMKDAVDECAWLLMIAPINALVSLFMHSLENMLMVPNLVRVLRKLPKYCNIELNTTMHEDGDLKFKSPVLMLALRHILTNEREFLQTDSKQKNYVYLCAALCRERREVLKSESGEENENEDAEIYGDIVDSSLVDGSLVLNYLVLPAMRDVFYQDIVLEVGKKLLTAIGARRTPIIWKDERGVKLNCVKVEAATKNNPGISVLNFISTLLDVYNENKGSDYALAGSSQDCLQCLGQRLKEDGVKIELDAFRGLLKCFDDTSLWTYRYAVSSWFSGCLVSYKIEVPALLYNALKKEKRQFFKVMKAYINDDTSERCLFRMLFEIAAIDPDLAVDLLKGFSTSKEFASHDVSGAVVDVIRDREGFPEYKIFSFVEVIKTIISQIDPSRPAWPFLTDFSESIFYGIRLIEPLLIIHEAVICAIHYEQKATDDLNAVPFDILEYTNEAAVKLLKLFCELVKDHMEKEMIDLRRSRLKYKPEIKDPRPVPTNMIINREVRVETELTQLYIAAVMLSNHIDGMPCYLKILLVQLTTYHIELSKIKLGSNFDGVVGKALKDCSSSEKPESNALKPSDSDQLVTSVNINGDSASAAVTDDMFEVNKSNSYDCKSPETIQSSFHPVCNENDRLQQTASQQTSLFLASTYLIGDEATSSIIVKRLNNARNSGKTKQRNNRPRRGALPPSSELDGSKRGVRTKNKERRFNGDGAAGTDDGQSNGRTNVDHRKNKNQI